MRSPQSRDTIAIIAIPANPIANSAAKMAKAQSRTSASKNGVSFNDAKTELLSPLEVLLDSENPRLSPDEQGSDQNDLLKTLHDRFKLLELGASIVESGYVPFDPLVGARDADGAVVVLEGNRRIAALKLLLGPDAAPFRHRKTWSSLADRLTPTKRKDLDPVGVRVFQSRTDADVSSYIGFRHVTSVLKWPALEKAAYIARMVEDQGWTYEEVARRLGSKGAHVEKHYIAYRFVAQAREAEIPGHENIERSFGVLLRALQAGGISEFLGIEYPRDPKKSLTPVSLEEKAVEVKNFVAWTFGTEEQDRVLPESRRLTEWGKILQDPKAYRYLKTAARPSFERAWQKCGGEAESLIDGLWQAANRLEEAVPIVGEHAKNEEVLEAVSECERFLKQVVEKAGS